MRTMFLVSLGVLLVMGVSAARSWGADERSDEELERGYVVFEHNPLAMLPGDYVPPPEKTATQLHCALARGQYASAQVGVHALDDDLLNVRVSVTSSLPVSVYRRADRVAAFTPEATAADLDQRIGTNHDWSMLQRGDTLERVPAGASVNFWFTFHAPADTAPGLHHGLIRVEAEGRPATELDLVVEVRPFELAPARIPFGLWYSRGQYSVGRGPDAPHEFVYRDMAEHSHNSVSFSMPRDFGVGAVDLTQLPLSDDSPMVRIINTAREAGLVSEHFPSTLESSPLRHEYREGRTSFTYAQLAAAVDWLREQQREQGWPELMVYGWDEPPVPAEGMREHYTVLRSLPIRLATALSAKAAYAYGDLHDVWMVHDGHVTPEMQKEAARMGAQVWTYTYRLWRQGYDPVVQRFYAGLHTWALELDGNWIWEYYYGYNWVHPDTHETMPTTGWEARREGIDDYRYLQMLEDSIAANPGHPAAAEATVWLETLRSRVIAAYDHDEDYYWPYGEPIFAPGTLRVGPHLVEAGKPLRLEEYEQIRATVTDYLLKLGVVSSSQRQPAQVSYVKDEAAPFRNSSVAECLAGLRSSRATTRRAAAWALFEQGPAAAAAVPELTRALEDPEVRIPALKALEAIGSGAIAAAPQVAALLSHPDDFLRQGAALTLQGLTTVHTELLLETPEQWIFRLDPQSVGEAQQWCLPTVAKQAPDWNPQSTHEVWEAGYIGHGWYTTDLVIPDAGDKRVWLHFGAVDENYTLWINGQYVADNMADGPHYWNLPVQAEITGRFNPGGENHIVVRVRNTGGGGGICKPVTVLVEQ